MKGFQALLASYINSHQDSRLFYGKSLTLGGSVKPESSGGASYYSGDLSAVLLQNSPKAVERLKKTIGPIQKFFEKLSNIKLWKGHSALDELLDNDASAYNALKELEEMDER